MKLGNLYRRLPDWTRRAIDDQRFRLGMSTMFGSLANLKRAGFIPGSIIDAGAYVGRWTEEVKTIYPETRVLMIEANPEKESLLRAVQKKFGGSVEYRKTLLGASSAKDVTFYSMETGSSVLPELTNLPRSVISLEMETLDDVVASAELLDPLLLKLDVQGYELEVLRGAAQTLERTEVVVVEMSVQQYNEGGPLVGEYFRTTSEYGFSLYDICGQLRRGSDRALQQIDGIFVRNDSPLRR